MDNTTDVYGTNPEINPEVGIPDPTSKLVVDKNDELLRWIQNEKIRAMPHVEEWREDAAQCYRFRDGSQYSEADRKKLNDDLRPANAFNAAQKFVRFVSGVERYAPEAIIFESVDENDVTGQDFGEFMTRIYDWAIENSDGDHERSNAFEDLVVSGMGWGEYMIDKRIEPRGLIGINRLPWDEMIWPECRNLNLKGTRWRARQTKIDKEEAANQFPDYEGLILGARLSRTGSSFPESRGTIKYKIPFIETFPIAGSGAEADRDEVEIMEWQWYDDEQGFYFYDPLQRKDVWLDRKSFRTYQSRLQKYFNKPISDYVRQQRRIFQKIFVLNDNYLISDPMQLPGNRFTFNCMTAHFDEDKKIFYGLFRVLIDPQKYANKFFNQVIEIVGTQAKGGLMVEENAIDAKNVDEFEKKYAVPGSVNMVAPGAIAENRIKEKALPQLPAATMSLMEYCVRSMEDVSGITPESAWGQGAVPMPGVTMKQKNKAGLILLASEFDSLSRYRKEEGRIIFDLAGLLADDRLILVGKPMEGNVIQLLREPFEREYRLSIDDTERDPNLRHAYTESIVSLAPTLLRMNLFLPELLDYVLLPVKFRMALKKAIVAMGQAKQEAAEKGVQTHGRGSPVTPEERAAKVKKIEADTMAQLARAQRIRGQQARDEDKMQLEEMKLLVKTALEKEKLRLDNIKAASDVALRGVDLAAWSKIEQRKANATENRRSNR